MEGIHPLAASRPVLPTRVVLSHLHGITFGLTDMFVFLCFLSPEIYKLQFLEVYVREHFQLLIASLS